MLTGKELAEAMQMVRARPDWPNDELAEYLMQAWGISLQGALRVIRRVRGFFPV